MNWYIGQPIVAIRNSECGRIKKGEEFIIKGLRKCNCKCTSIEIDIGLISEEAIIGYVKCLSDNMVYYQDSKIHWKIQELFAPLDINISELTDILKEPIPCNTHYHAM